MARMDVFDGMLNGMPNRMGFAFGFFSDGALGFVFGDLN